jgi:hypothetical protein
MNLLFGMAKMGEKLRLQPYFFAPSSKMKKVAKNGRKVKTALLDQYTSPGIQYYHVSKIKQYGWLSYS